MMEHTTKAGRKYLVGVLTVYVLICSIAAVYSYFKLKSLDFHPRDFPFYLQFAVKLSDPNLSDRYSLNPDGHNFIGFYGTEGETNFHQMLHLEPVKYIYAVLYKIFKTPLILFLFSAFIFFLPVVYFALIHYKREESDRGIVWFFTLFYIFLTLSLETASFDLRPFAFLGPVFAMLIFSIHFNRPHWESILLFNGLFLIREEAMIFAFGALLYTFAKEYTTAKKFPLAKIFTFNGLVWVGLEFLYYGWTGYAFTSRVGILLRVNKSNMIPLGIAFILFAGLVYAGFFLIKKQNPHTASSLLMLFTYSLIFIPVILGIFPYISHSSLELLLLQVFHGPKFYFLYITVLVFFVLFRDMFLKNRGKKILTYISFLLAGYFTVSTGLAAYYTFKKYIKESKTANIVFAVRGDADKYKTGILCDYLTYQAFCDYEKVYCFERLPWYMINGPDRYYPTNVNELKRLLKENIDYVVLGMKRKQRALTHEIITVLNLHKIPWHARNNSYIIYKIERKTK
jgi:hypothetical protein